MMSFIFHTMTPHERLLFARFAMKPVALCCKVMLTQLIIEKEAQ